MTVVEKAATLIKLMGGISNIRRIDVVQRGVDGLIFLIDNKPDIRQIKAMQGVIDVEADSPTVITVRFGENGTAQELFKWMELIFRHAKPTE